MIELLKHEFFIQNKIYNLIKYFLIFFVFSSASITIVNSYESIKNFGIIFSVIAIPLALIAIPVNFLKPEIKDGTLELLLASFSPNQIILAKYFSLFLCASVGFCLNLPFSWFIFSINNDKLLLVAICGLCLTISGSAIITLISSIQCYFHSNTNFLSILIMPLIIPSIIISGMIIQDDNTYSMIMILIGINCIITPVAIFFSSYLIANIYNM